MGEVIDFSGQTVVVTGGTKGVGAGIAKRFLDAGATVVVCGRNEPESLPRSEKKTGNSEAVFVKADVGDVEQIEQVIAFTMDNYGRFDVLVNNAGGSPSVDAATVSPRFSEAIIRLNLVAPLNFAQKANQVMQKSEGGGSIINIASVSGCRPSPGTAAYGAAKAGLLNLTRSLAVEWAPRVRVNAITAGMIRTEQSELHYGDEAGVAAVAATVPLGRLAEPADIGDICLFLASPLASYVSGAEILAHGGGEMPAFLDVANVGTDK